MFIEQLEIYIDEFPIYNALVCLTHWHSDHLRGLRKNFTGTIICSDLTLALLNQRWPKAQVKDLEMNVVVIKPAQGTITVPRPSPSKKSLQVQVFDANHLPGSLMFYFADSNILFTGDYRLNESMLKQLEEYITPHPTIYFDGTFHDPSLRFTSEHEALQLLESELSAAVARYKNVLLGVFHLGTLMFLQKLNRRANVRVETFSKKMQQNFTVMYPLLHDPDCKITVANIHKLTQHEKQQFGKIIIPSSLWFTCLGQDKKDITKPVEDGKGITRVNCSAHSDYYDNFELFRALKARTCIATCEPKVKLKCT